MGTDSVWIFGTAASDQVPTTPNAIQPQGPQLGVEFGSEGFAIKLSSSGDLLYGTYVGNNREQQLLLSPHRFHRRRGSRRSGQTLFRAN